MWLVFAAIGVFFGGAGVYLALMIFFPEWVGITGKTALEAEQSHRGESPKDSAKMSSEFSPSPASSSLVEGATETSHSEKPSS